MCSAELSMKKVLKLRGRGVFNDMSALGRSLYWCQALHITNIDRYQNNERPQMLALLNSRLWLPRMYWACSEYKLQKLSADDPNR